VDLAATERRLDMLEVRIQTFEWIVGLDGSACSSYRASRRLAEGGGGGVTSRPLAGAEANYHTSVCMTLIFLVRGCR
jgi:hypothetical protein